MELFEDPQHHIPIGKIGGGQVLDAMVLITGRGKATNQRINIKFAFTSHTGDDTVSGQGVS